MADLKELLDPVVKDKAVYADRIDPKYLTDYIGSNVGRADAYVKAANEDDIIQVLKIAYAHKINVVVRGAGTNLTGATVPDGGIVLDVSNMNRIIELDESTLTVTVEPGVRLKDLIEYTRARGFLYAPDPAEKNATIGGNVSTNAGGMRAVKYGVTRNYVLALDLIKIDGTKLTLGSKTYKYSTGLNLQQLVIGSEGTLGVITKIVLRLLPLPAFTLNTIIAFDSLSDAVFTVNVILRSHLNPTAIEFIEKKVVEYGERYVHKSFPCADAQAYLLVTLDGNQDEVSKRFNDLATLVRAHKAKDVIALDNDHLAQDVWEIRGAVAKAVNATGPWEPVDIVVPIDKITDYIDYVQQLSDQGGPRIVAFGHAGDGNIHLCILKDHIDSATWPIVLKATLRHLYQQAYALGGIVSGEHGIGKGKRAFFLANTDPELRSLMTAIKHSFDEFNLLNPHSSYTL